MFLVNSRLGLFAAAPSRSGSKSLHANGAPLLPKLRGQFAEFLSEGSLDRLSILYSPTCVGLGYGHQDSSLGAFLGGMGSATSPKSGSASRLRLVCRQAFDSAAPYTLARGQPPPRFAYPSASPHQSSAAWWYRNINRLSIDYAFRPRLRSRLTLGGLTFPRNPWAFGGRVSRPSLATHAGILTSLRSTD